MVKNKKNIQAKIPKSELNFSLLPFVNHKMAYWCLGIIAFILYINTVKNEFALDDGIIIHKNEFVMKGSSGIKDILTHDAYYSFYRSMNAEDQLPGGRYRPLSVVSFAIEQSWVREFKDGKVNPTDWDINKNNVLDPEEDINGDGLGNLNDPLTEGCGLRHFNNMLFYLLLVLLIYKFLKEYLFKENHDVAFLASFLFCVHPIHTEVVANMKSRDEIFSLIFILLSFIYFFKAVDTSKLSNLIKASALFFLALLSKEYAVTLLIVVPASIFIYRNDYFNSKGNKLIFVIAGFFVSAIVMYVFEKEGSKAFWLMPFLYGFYLFLVAGSEFSKVNFSAMLGSLAFSFLFYIAMRFNATVLNPKIAETANEILNQPYLLASKPQEYATKIFVLLKYILLLFFPFKLSSDYSYNTIVYRSFTSWDTLLSIFIHLGLAFLTLKLFIKKHPLAFALLFYFANLFMIGNIVFDIGATMGERLIFHSSLGFSIAVAWLLVKGLEIISISFQSKRIVILTLTVALGIPLGYKTIARNAEWKNDITLFTTDVNTVPNSVLCLGNAGARWIDLSERPENKNAGKEKEYINKAIGYLNHAIELHPKYVNGYLNLGLAYFKLGNYEKAEATWKRAESYYPNNPYLNSYYQFLGNEYMRIANEKGQNKDYAEAEKFYEKATLINKDNPETWYNLGGVNFMLKNYEKAKTSFENCLKLNPNYPQAKEGLNSVNQIISSSPAAITLAQ